MDGGVCRWFGRLDSPYETVYYLEGFRELRLKLAAKPCIFLCATYACLCVWVCMYSVCIYVCDCV